LHLFLFKNLSISAKILLYVDFAGWFSTRQRDVIFGLPQNGRFYYMEDDMKNFNLSINKLIVSLVCFVGALVLAPTVTAEAASNDEIQAITQVFDSAYYKATYPDVADRFSNEIDYLNHYLYIGIYEGRNASGTFNATDYMNKNPDLVAIYGDNMPAYVYHYVHAGKAEGRDATPTVGATDVVFPQQYTLLGTYTTEYDATAARGTNIAIAASHVNGTVVAPGSTFSANLAIGPRTAANGFVEAPVFINKEHAMGIGGGVCQVSSTIYAAMKTAGISASERHPHSLPVYYLPEGWDATISGNTLDLKFVNRYDSNILVNITANNGILTAALYLEN